MAQTILAVVVVLPVELHQPVHRFWQQWGIGCIWWRSWRNWWNFHHFGIRR
jgi:hypothetical protein